MVRELKQKQAKGSSLGDSWFAEICHVDIDLQYGARNQTRTRI
jgi:hypothetical protein